MKTRRTWSEIKRALGTDEAPARPMRPAQAFWEDFRARAALFPQRAPAPRLSSLRAYGWFAAAGALAAAVVLASVYMFGGAAAPAGLSTVQSYSVGVKHSAVVLLTDQAAQSTILWVAGMESPGKGEL